VSDGDLKSAGPIRDFVREKTDSGEWGAIDTLAGLQTVFLLYGLDLGISLPDMIGGLTEGYLHITGQSPVALVETPSSSSEESEP
jgi:hypothetical protein